MWCAVTGCRMLLLLLLCVCVCSALSLCLSSLQCFPAAFRKQLSGWKNRFPDRTTRPSPPCSSYWETMEGLLQGHEDVCVSVCVCGWGRFIEVVLGCLLESADLSMQQKGCHVLFSLNFPGRSHQRNVFLVSMREWVQDQCPVLVSRWPGLKVRWMFMLRYTYLF